MKLVMILASVAGASMPAFLPASMHLRIQAMLRPRVRNDLQAFFVFLDFFRRVAVDHGPVVGCDADHLGDKPGIY